VGDGGWAFVCRRCAHGAAKPLSETPFDQLLPGPHVCVVSLCPSCFVGASAWQATMLAVGAVLWCSVRGVLPVMKIPNRAFSENIRRARLELSPFAGLESCCGGTFLGCLRHTPLQHSLLCCCKVCVLFVVCWLQSWCLAWRAAFWVMKNTRQSRRSA
jgi:hypothetical protein